MQDFQLAWIRVNNKTKNWPPFSFLKTKNYLYKVYEKEQVYYTVLEQRHASLHNSFNSWELRPAQDS